MSLPAGYETSFGPVVTAAHTWRSVDLVAAADHPPAPPCIGGLLYPGKRTLLSGETESMKTWLGLILAKAEIDAGFPVGWVDLDAMGRGETLARLRLLGLTDDDIAQNFLFYEPEQRLADVALADVTAELADRNARLFVIDAFNPMLSLHGLDPASTPDVEGFWREVAKPICDAGPSPTLLDHVVKNAENRGKYAYGSERKASGANVHIGFKLLESFSRGGNGRTLLTTHKDRAGFLPRPTIGVLELLSDGDQITYALHVDHSRDRDKFRPTFLMQRVSEYLESCGEPMSRKAIEQNVSGKGEAVRTAIDVLIEEGYARGSEGKHGAKLAEHVRPYREIDDADEAPEQTSSQPRPNLVPSLLSTPSADLVPSSLPKGDEDEVAGRPRPSTSSLVEKAGEVAILAELEELKADGVLRELPRSPE